MYRCINNNSVETIKAYHNIDKCCISSFLHVVSFALGKKHITIFLFFHCCHSDIIFILFTLLHEENDDQVREWLFFFFFQ